MCLEAHCVLVFIFSIACIFRESFSNDDNNPYLIK